MVNESQQEEKNHEEFLIEGYVTVRFSAPREDDRFVLNVGRNYVLEAGFQLDAPPSYKGEHHPIASSTARLAFDVVCLGDELSIEPWADKVYKYENGEPSWTEFNISPVPVEDGQETARESEIRVHFMYGGRIGRSFRFPVKIV